MLLQSPLSNEVCHQNVLSAVSGAPSGTFLLMLMAMTFEGTASPTLGRKKCGWQRPGLHVRDRLCIPKSAGTSWEPTRWASPIPSTPLPADPGAPYLRGLQAAPTPSCLWDLGSGTELNPCSHLSLHLTLTPSVSACPLGVLQHLVELLEMLPGVQTHKAGQAVILGRAL